jgi:hypothetical protein
MTASYHNFTNTAPVEELPTQHTLEVVETPRELVFTPASAEDAQTLLDKIKAITGNEQPTEFVSPNAPGLDVSMDRPGDYLTLPEQRATPPETGVGRNRGKIYSEPVQADNKEELTGTQGRTDFGNEFPANPTKGDTYLRVDYLPNRLFKFNGQKWIQVAKEQTDVYAYEEEYIKHLINEIDAGRYDIDTLSDTERAQIQQYLAK